MNCSLNAQFTFSNFQPAYWRIYDFSTTSSDDGWRSRDALVINAPRNGNLVIDSVILIDGNNNVAFFNFDFIDSHNQYSKRLYYLPLTNYRRERTWEYNQQGRPLREFELSLSSMDTTLINFRKFILNSNGLIEQLYFGYDTVPVQLDSISNEFGFVNYYYTGMRLDSSSYYFLNGSHRGTEYYFYTNTQFDSLVYINSSKTIFQRNIFSYDANGRITKDSASYVWANTPQNNYQRAINWVYTPSGSIDSIYYVDYISNGIILRRPPLKFYYNAFNNYDSVLVGTSSKYLFTYQASTFGNDEFDLNEAFQPYPNPVQSGGTVKVEDGTVSAKLYAIDGKLISSFNVIIEDKLVLPANLPPGMYLLQWQLDKVKTPRVQRIIVKN